MNFQLIRYDTAEGLRQMLVQHWSINVKYAIISVDGRITFTEANTEWSAQELTMLCELSRNFITIYCSLPVKEIAN